MDSITKQWWKRKKKRLNPMSIDAVANYKHRFDQSKAVAENGIHSGINTIINEITAAARTLAANGQKVEINIDEIVADLNTVRDEWLTSVRTGFDSAISGLKAELEKSCANSEPAIAGRASAVETRTVKSSGRSD